MTIDSLDDLIDVRDVITRIEELRADRDRYLDPEISEDDPGLHADAWADKNPDEAGELADLTALMIQLANAGGGDEQWEGAWYPLTMIRDSYFTDYARELLEDCGDVPATMPHYIEIDWQATARNIRTDYTSVEFQGVTYWVR